MKNPSKLTLATGAIVAIIAASNLHAQERLSRECMREVVQLCGTDRSKIRACLQEKAGQLSSSCKAELRERVQQRRKEGDPQASVSLINPTGVVVYGAHERQAVDFYAANNPEASPPLVMFIHGGGWSFGNREQTVRQKPAHFVNSGFAFASAGYRVLPDAPVEDQAADIVSAIASLRAQSDTLGFDPDRIVLMGHSAGAHLAALVSANEALVGDHLSAISGVILLDGAGYDIAEQMRPSGSELPRLYSTVFGDDPDRHARLSPITYAGAPNAPAWLILHVADRARSGKQSRDLANELVINGTEAIALAIEGTDHGRMNRELGLPGDRTTAEVDAFLARLFA